MTTFPTASLSAPRIAVTGVVRTWDGGERTGVNAAYVRAVVAAGGIPIILSPLVGTRYVGRSLDGIDGLLLTGGEDVNPTLYDAAPSPLLGTVDRARDMFELAVFATARARAIPVLGVCRGIQLINVGLGGTLYQDLATERPSPTIHDAAASRDVRMHGIRLESDSRAARALGTHALQVNSIHHQGIRDLAPALRATAWADDGLIEAVETGAAEEGWLLAVQWHPEEMHADRAAPDGGLFRALVQEARRTAAAPDSMHAEIAERPVG
jgi:gamma-glutamyl-gamma-aminobutyrate hydrolase PuuD